MERNQNGYPVTHTAPGQNGAYGNSHGSANEQYAPREGCSRMREREKCEVNENPCLDSLPIGYAYVPMQKFRMLYPADTALQNGTLFEELNKPVGVYGNE